MTGGLGFVVPFGDLSGKAAKPVVDIPSIFRVLFSPPLLVSVLSCNGWAVLVLSMGDIVSAFGGFSAAASSVVILKFGELAVKPGGGLFPCCWKFYW